MSFLKRLAFGLCFFLCGCGGDTIISTIKSVFTLQPAKVWLQTVHFRASDNVNDESPITVHVVVVYTVDLLAELLKMDSDSYFRKIDQIKLDNAGKLDVFSWDLIRGQHFDAEITPRRVDGEGVVVFARYGSPGPHRLTISDDKEVNILLEKLDFKIQKMKVAS